MKWNHTQSLGRDKPKRTSVYIPITLQPSRFHSNPPVSFQSEDDFLQALQKPPRMRTVHLGVVELKRQLQRRPEKPPVIFAPDDERVVENAAVHADSPVDFGIHNGGCTDHHAVCQIVIFAAFRHLACQAQIVNVEPGKTVREGHIAGADLTGLVFHNGIDRNAIAAVRIPPGADKTL